MKQKAIVLEKLLDCYVVKVNENIIRAYIKGSMKKNLNILVGDYVYVEKSYDKYIINKVEKRINHLIRPPVANIDLLLIVISVNEPLPDFILLDKQLILCYEKNIKPVICVNKIDLDKNNNEIKDYLDSVYRKFGVDIVFISTKKEVGFEQLFKIIKEKVCALSGNSGVGKSSLVKYILKSLELHSENIEVNKISKKLSRGRHTTKYVKLYVLNKDTYILDTPGFSSYELYNIEYKKLHDLYPDFKKYKCEFDDCMHIKESDKYCKVKEAVKQKKLDVERYKRYVYIFERLKELESKKYK